MPLTVRHRLRYPFFGAVLSAAVALATFACAALLDDDPVFGDAPDGAEPDSASADGGNECGANLQTNIDNCGACGRSCREEDGRGQCLTGACVGQVFATVGDVDTIAASKQIVVWSEGKQLTKCAPPAPCDDAGTSTVDVASLAASGDQFAYRASTVKVCRADGSCVTPTQQPSGSTPVAMDEKEVFFGGTSATIIHRCSNTDASACDTIVEATKPQSPKLFALTPGHLIWATGTELRQCHRSQGCGDSGVAPTALADAGQASSLVAIGEEVYFVVMGSNDILRCSTADGCALGPTIFASAQEQPSSLAAAGDKLVWLSKGGTEVRGCLVTDCSTPTLLARSLSNTKLATSDTHIYFTKIVGAGGAGELLRVPR